jgi:hypothetical protein
VFNGRARSGQACAGYAPGRGSLTPPSESPTREGMIGRTSDSNRTA